MHSGGGQRRGGGDISKRYRAAPAPTRRDLRVETQSHAGDWREKQELHTERDTTNSPFTFEHKGRSRSDSRLSGDRNRLTGGSQSISKCAREIRRTVSQFLKVHGQVSQFLNVPRSGRMPKVGPGAYL